MAYVSELLGKPVVEASGERVGQLVDLIAAARGEMPHPKIVAVVVKSGRRTVAVPFSKVALLAVPAVALAQPLADVTPYQPGERDLYLARDVLDKQIIDTDGMRVVRVNDLEIKRVNDHFYVANVDIGTLGLFRRLGLARTMQRVTGRLGRGLAESIISWDGVELLGGDQPMRLKVSAKRIADLHPADLAEILSDLNRTESGKLLDSLDVKTVADTLEAVEPDFQASLVEEMTDEKVADVLEEMAPDEAADLLAELPQDRSRDLLELMEDEDAEDVRHLLSYPDGSAGGIMTTEFFAIRPDLTAAQAIDELRQTAQRGRDGLLRLRHRRRRPPGGCLFPQRPGAGPARHAGGPLHALPRGLRQGRRQSERRAPRRSPSTTSWPCPSSTTQQRLVGIVTADDALDKIIPTAWKKRLPHMYR